MKIQHSHYCTFSELFNQQLVIDENQDGLSLSDYRKAGLSDMRYRWDVTWRSQAMREFITKHLYSYLNDSHIDTVLKRLTDTK